MDMAERKISDVLAKPDVALEMTLRPSLFSEFVGQANIKERLDYSRAIYDADKTAPGFGAMTGAMVGVLSTVPAGSSTR